MVDPVESRVLLAISLAVGDVSGSEAQGPLNFPVIRTGGTAGSISGLTATTQSGTALAGTDFTSINAPVNVPDGAGGGSVAVTPANDALHETNETFSLRLAGNPTLLGAAPSFGTRADFPAMGRIGATAVADVNSDGVPDIVATASQFVSVFVNSQPPSTGFVRGDFALPTHSPWDVVVTDLNADGRPDIAVTGGPTNGGYVSVLFNTTPAGSGFNVSFAPAVEYVIGDQGSDIEAVDLNQDGRTDLAVSQFGFFGGQGGGGLVMLNNTPAGAAAPTFALQPLADAGNNLHSVGADDVNLDGKRDLVVTAINAQPVILFNQTPPGAANVSFAAPQALNTGLSANSNVTFDDVNGDGRNDVIALGGSSTNATSVMLNQTSPGAAQATWGTPLLFATSLGRVVDVADVNGDGRPDMLFSTSSGFGARVMLNVTPTGAAVASFTSSTQISVPSVIHDSVVGDFTMDGVPDLVIARANDSAVSFLSLLPGTTPMNASDVPHFAGPSLTPGQRPHAVAVGDLNGDGRADLAVANEQSGDVSVFLRTSAPGAAPAFATPVNFASGSLNVSLVMQDFNGDGRLDLATANAGGNALAVLINTTAPGAAAPSFAAAHSLPVGARPRYVAACDFNGDGRIDLASANFDDDTLSVLMNQTAPGAAAPAFAPRQDFAAADGPIALAVGDYNGDGRADLASAAYHASRVSVLLNETAPGAAAPAFGARADVTTGAQPRSVAAGDFNGDGRPDLAVATTAEGGGANTLSVHVNTTALGATNAGFDTRQDFAAGSVPIAVAVVDVNLDGRPDLAVANWQSNNVSVLLNGTAPGAATLAFPQKADFAVDAAPIHVAAADLDGDGRPELLAAGYDAGRVSVLRNQPVVIGDDLATGTILNDDAPPAVRFQSATQVAEEAAGAVTVRVDLSIVSGLHTTIPFTLGGTATEGADYTLAEPSPLFIPAGSTFGTVTINLIDEQLVEPAETIVLTLGTPTNGTPGSPGVHTVTVNDNDSTLPVHEASEFRFLTGPQSLRFRFSRDVSASLSTTDLVLLNQTNNTTVDPAAMALAYDATTNTATFTFPGLPGEYLADGDYRALIGRNSVTDPSGNPLAGDVVFDFFFLQGDANRDRRVNLEDFNILAANFGQTPRNFSQGDFNYDALVNLADFNLLAARFGQNLDASDADARDADEDDERLTGDLGDLIA